MMIQTQPLAHLCVPHGSRIMTHLLLLQLGLPETDDSLTNQFKAQTGVYLYLCLVTVAQLVGGGGGGAKCRMGGHRFTSWLEHQLKGCMEKSSKLRLINYLICLPNCVVFL